MNVSAARRDHRSSSQYDVVNPIEHRTNLANAGAVHDGRLPHADEVVGRQLLLQVRHRFTQQVTAAGSVYAGVVSRGFDPQNVRNGNKENPLIVLHHKAFQRAETAEGSEQWFEISICFPALLENLPCVNQRLGKSLLIIRFQQIVNCVHFECADGVHIVSPMAGLRLGKCALEIPPVRMKMDTPIFFPCRGSQWRIDELSSAHNLMLP